MFSFLAFFIFQGWDGEVDDNKLMAIPLSGAEEDCSSTDEGEDPPLSPFSV